MDVDSMSDAELRAKLVEYGFPVMPITGTTRKTMAKKLKMLLENKTKLGRHDRRSLGKYSSEEESDDADAVQTRRDVRKRVTMAAPMMSPPSPPRAPVKEIKSTLTSTRTTKILSAAARDDFDTGSESDEIAEKYDPISPERSSTTYRKTPTPTRLPTSYLSASSAAEAAAERLNQMRSRLSSQYSPSTLSTSAGSSASLGAGGDDFEENQTPFLSNFTKRLSTLSSLESPKIGGSVRSDIVKENDVNGGGASSPSAKGYLSSYRTTRGRPSTYDYKRTASSSEDNILKNNLVPLMVLVVAFLFFLVVGVVYLGIRSDSSLDVTAAKPICVKTDPNSRRYVNCVLENEANDALNLLQVLKPELVKRALANRCQDDKIKPYMSRKDVVAFVTNNYAIKNESRIVIDLSNLQVLTFYNPSWGVSVAKLPEDGAEFVPSAIVEKMEDVSEGLGSDILALITPNPYIPWKCYLYGICSTVLSIAVSIVLGVGILWAVNHGYKLYAARKERERDEVISLVEAIIDVLQTNCSDSAAAEHSFMVINHVRDMIIPITERKSKEKMWRSAVKYIEENESRIRPEVQVVRGEPSEVWRWLGGTLNTSGSPHSKSWQGQAFETQVGSVNSLPCSPTPCLKIRGMIREGERNTAQVRKAVLSKCTAQCRILHCSIEPAMSSVYLKCADTADAAIAYRNLHGWWYDGNLVTVKYMRLERYMQRFPDSPANGPPFLQ